MMLQVVLIIIAIFVLGIFGIFGNINIIAATVRTRELQNKCGLLIGILGFCDLFCIIFEWQNLVRLLLGIQNYRFSCYVLITPYIFMINFQSTIILVVSFDRLLAIMLPIKYRVVRNDLYVLAVMTPGALYGISITIAGYMYMIDEPIEVCNPPLGFAPNVSYWWNKITIGINFVVLFVYLLTIIALKYKVGNAPSSGKSYYKRQQAIMKNLSVMILFFIFSWFLAHASVHLVTLLGLGESMLHIAQSMAVIPAMLCFCQNYYIYFWRSEVYRSIFKQQFWKILGCFGYKNTVGQIYTAEAMTGTSKFHSGTHGNAVKKEQKASSLRNPSV
ncbi:hypothetical protein L596_016255 [Steinernema carpocapsae]|uniref:G-protein coupled receptors family 1 profile domain-containing protein n=1 Tax=Steinernema carpocapsae TaxID=34508 RepID=A0A4U5NI78_STECR|nr:hypothetical protein L596_016255 [Steinernema carpocapsae]